jgi:hypothetical protein
MYVGFIQAAAEKFACKMIGVRNLVALKTSLLGGELR